MGPGVNGAAGFAGDAVDGEAAGFFPAHDGADVLAQEGGDFFPGAESGGGSFDHWRATFGYHFSTGWGFGEVTADVALCRVMPGCGNAGWG